MDQDTDDADGEEDEEYLQDRRAKRKRPAGGKRKGERQIKFCVLRAFIYFIQVDSTPESDDSDSASDFENETPAKKKLKRYHNDGNGPEDFRFSSRGGRLPNYYENDDMSMDDSDSDEDHVPGSDVPAEQVHEIEMVLDHHRDDDKKDDREDNFNTNMVRLLRQRFADFV